MKLLSNRQALFFITYKHKKKKIFKEVANVNVNVPKSLRLFQKR